jgi:hypothetical protein
MVYARVLHIFTHFYTRTLFVFPEIDSPEPGVSTPAAAGGLDGVETPSTPSGVFGLRPDFIGLVCGVCP